MAFVPENALETALMHAAKEAAARPEFYRLLLESDLLVLGRVSCARPETAGPTVLPGDRLEITSAQINGRTCHPLFSSATKFESGSCNTPFDGWKLRGRAVRTIVNGRTVWEVGSGLRP